MHHRLVALFVATNMTHKLHCVYMQQEEARGGTDSHGLESK